MTVSLLIWVESALANLCIFLDGGALYSGYEGYELYLSLSLQLISLVTCVGLQKEEPQTALPHVLYMCLIEPLACSWDVKLYPTNLSLELYGC